MAVSRWPQSRSGRELVINKTVGMSGGTGQGDFPPPEPLPYHQNALDFLLPTPPTPAKDIGRKKGPCQILRVKRKPFFNSCVSSLSL